MFWNCVTYQCFKIIVMLSFFLSFFHSFFILFMFFIHSLYIPCIRWKWWRCGPGWEETAGSNFVEPGVSAKGTPPATSRPERIIRAPDRHGDCKLNAICSYGYLMAPKNRVESLNAFLQKRTIEYFLFKSDYTQRAPPLRKQRRSGILRLQYLQIDRFLQIWIFGSKYWSELLKKTKYWRKNRGFTLSPEVKVYPLIDSPMTLCNQPRRRSRDYTHV